MEGFFSDLAKRFRQAIGQALWPSDLAERFGQAMWPSNLAKRFGQAIWPSALAKLASRGLPRDRPGVPRDHGGAPGTPRDPTGSGAAFDAAKIGLKSA